MSYNLYYMSNVNSKDMSSPDPSVDPENVLTEDVEEVTPENTPEAFDDKGMRINPDSLPNGVDDL